MNKIEKISKIFANSQAKIIEITDTLANPDHCPFQVIESNGKKLFELSALVKNFGWLASYYGKIKGNDDEKVKLLLEEVMRELSFHDRDPMQHGDAVHTLLSHYDRLALVKARAILEA